VLCIRKLPVCTQTLSLSWVFGLSKPNSESRRADSNRFTAHYERSLRRCRGLHGLANAPFLGDFLCSGLLSVAPYCVPGGIRVVSHSCSTMLLARGTPTSCPLWVGTPLREWTRR
jgi:hypothetical protein